jgi:predicted transcriptional regulator
MVNKSFALRIDNDLADWLEARAADMHCPASVVIRMAIAQMMDRDLKAKSEQKPDSTEKK